MRRSSSWLRSFLRNERGNVAITFGLLTIPAVMIVGSAVDFGRAIQAREKLQAAADAAVVAAAALEQSATSQQRINQATSIFNANAASLGATPSVTVSGATVSITASSAVSTAFLGVMQLTSIPVEASASATASYTTPPSNNKICMLALDPNSTDGIHVQGNNTMSYPGCWAHTNSTQATAINANGSQATVSGAGHCAVGGAETPHNNFSPAPTTGCAKVEDPFANVGAYELAQIYSPKFTPPTIASTCKSQSLNLKKGTFTLGPGRYCGGIEIQAQANVTFEPGEYIIDNGHFLVQSGSTAVGSNVLFYFSGANARMTVIGGGTVNLKGRYTGSSYEGMLFIAHPDAWRGGTSNIQGGGSFNLEGVLYMPTQRIEVGGNGDMNGSSKYFGMIAKDFYLIGNGNYMLRTRDSTSPLPDKLPVLPSTPTVSAIKVH